MIPWRSLNVFLIEYLESLCIFRNDVYIKQIGKFLVCTYFKRHCYVDNNKKIFVIIFWYKCQKQRDAVKGEIQPRTKLKNKIKNKVTVPGVF